MIDRTKRIGVLGTGGQTGHEIIALTGLVCADDGHAGRIDTLAHLNMVEVRFHLSASACPAVPVDVTTPSSDDNTGFDGTEHGVVSDSTVATTTADHSPSLSEYVGTALTLTSICVPQSKPPKPSCVLSVVPAACQARHPRACATRRRNC